MATVNIPDGMTKPVKIPKQCQIDIIEHPTGTKGSVILQCTNPPTKIDYPLPVHPYPVYFNLVNEDCPVLNRAAAGTPPGSSVDIESPFMAATGI